VLLIAVGIPVPIQKVGLKQNCLFFSLKTTRTPSVVRSAEIKLMGFLGSGIL
jgi:hypothetical protein